MTQITKSYLSHNDQWMHEFKKLKKLTWQNIFSVQIDLSAEKMHLLQTQ